MVLRAELRLGGAKHGTESYAWVEPIMVLRAKLCFDGANHGLES